MTLTLRHLSKTFPGQTALSDVNLSIEYGEVHALVGQNGSGKSTLIKVLAGYHTADPGLEAELEGAPFDLRAPQSAETAGLRFVHQDLGLVLTLSVLENTMLGREYPVGAGGRILWRESRRIARGSLGLLGMDIDLGTPVGALSLAERTGVAIARALSEAGSRRLIMVLDEPTAALPPDDVNQLLAIIDRLRGEGHGVLLVSHHLDEVLRIADRVTVLRDGKVVASAARHELDYDRLTELIVGHPVIVPSASVRSGRHPDDRAEAVLRVEGLSGHRIVDVGFEISAGQIIGVAGIAGSGREALAPLLTGRLPRSGSVRVDQAQLPSGEPARSLSLGLAQVPGERGRFGLFANLSVRGNMTISDLGRHRQWGRILRRAERKEVQDWIERLGIDTRGTEATITSLSGGNQQKVLVARALRLAPRVLVLDDPTQGIDIGARAQIHEVIEECAREGMAILLVSTDSDELARLSDTVVILARGRIADKLERGPGLTAAAIDVSQLAAAK